MLKIKVVVMVSGHAVCIKDSLGMLPLRPQWHLTLPADVFFTRSLTRAARKQIPAASDPITAGRDIFLVTGKNG